MTEQEFNKIVAKYEEHKQEVNHMYEVGVLHGLIKAMQYIYKAECYIPVAIQDEIRVQIEKIK